MTAAVHFHLDLVNCWKMYDFEIKQRIRESK